MTTNGATLNGKPSRQTRDVVIFNIFEYFTDVLALKVNLKFPPVLSWLVSISLAMNNILSFELFAHSLLFSPGGSNLSLSHISPLALSFSHLCLNLKNNRKQIKK